MKKQALFLIILIAFIFSGCKKNTDEIKDIKTLFSNTNWMGEFKYTSRPASEPVCIRFDAAGTFIWYEFKGEYGGIFTVNNDSKTVSLSFNGGGNFTASVTGDNKMTNLQYGGNYGWAVDSLQLNTTTISAQELAGTRWLGRETSFPIPPSVPLILNFKSSTRLDYTIDVRVVTNSAYTLNHAAIRFGNHFGVIKNGLISGVYANAGPFNEDWYAYKQ